MTNWTDIHEDFGNKSPYSLGKTYQQEFFTWWQEQQQTHIEQPPK